MHPSNEKDDNMDIGIPEVTPRTDILTAALAYAGAGLTVGPLVAGSKNPGSILGKGWPTKTSSSAEVVAGWFAGCADGTGIFLHAGACGLVIFDVDHPENVPKWLWEHLDTAPFQRTRSDGSPRRGHYIFQTPPGRRLGNSVGKITGTGNRGWGEVRGANGVIVVPPTLHQEADNGGHYRWVRTGAIPVLPDEVAQALPDTDGARDIADEGEVGQFLDYCTAAQASPFAARAILDRFAAEVEGGAGRHDACVRAACWIAREAAAGRFPARPVLGELRAAFLARFDERELRRRPVADEFDRVVGFAVGQLTGARIAEVIARHDTSGYDGPDDDPGEGGGEPPDEPQGPPRGGGDLWPGRKCSGLAQGRTGAAADGPPASGGLANLPEDFWGARPVLKHILMAAQARVISPDAVLACLLARVSSMIPPSVRVDTGIALASLNIFSVVVGDSSAGKSEAAAAARRLAPCPPFLCGMPDNDGLPLGSGEGMAEAYYGMVEEATGQEYASGPRKGQAKTKLVRKKVADHAFFYADEGEALVRVMERSGATVAPEIRRAWKADTLGQANASADRKRIVPEGSYALGLVLAFQPATIGPLFDDAAGGTPQRFLFASAHSALVADDGTAVWPGPLRNLVHALPLADLQLPLCARQEIRRWRVACRLPGAAPSGLDGHWPLHRAKVAALLAVLDFRGEVSDEDWELSGVVWETTRTVRDGLVAQFAQQRAARARAEDERRIRVRAEGAVAESRAVEDQVLSRVCRRVVRLVGDHGELAIGGRGGLRARIAARDRALLDEVIETVTARGEVIRDGDVLRPRRGGGWTVGQ